MRRVVCICTPTMFVDVARSSWRERAISEHSPPDETPKLDSLPRKSRLNVIVVSSSKQPDSVRISVDLPPAAVSWRQSPSPPSPTNFVFGATTHTYAWRGWSVRRPRFPSKVVDWPVVPALGRPYPRVGFSHGAIRKIRKIRCPSQNS